MMRPDSLRILFGVGILALAASAPLPARPAPDEGEGDTSRRAAELVAAKCLPCHNAGRASGGVNLADAGAAQASRAILPRDPAHSRAVSVTLNGKMPPTGRLAAEEVALLRTWVAQGAVFPKGGIRPPAPKLPGLWSLRPVQRPVVPNTRLDRLARNPIDRFLFAAMLRKGLRPSPESDRRALLRRVTVDLTGLPPTPQEMAAFLADKRLDAYERVVDRLLASPAYGERWARHWLDVVRYGESHGYEQNHLRPNAWVYRDYVIRAFNADLPYTRFIEDQMAGDVVGKGDPNTEAATGFLVAGIHDTVKIQEEQGTRQQRANDLDDIVSTTGATFLGLTVGCAKCHDHKFDPIPQRDFYRMAAAFSDVFHGERVLSSRLPTPQEQKRKADAEKRITELEQQVQVEEKSLIAALPPSHPLRVRQTGDFKPERNEVTFTPVTARYIRFIVHATRDGSEPCLDELQIFAPGSTDNLALASKRAKASASSLLPGYPIHQITHLNDGMFGNEHSWISNERGKGWAQIELPASTIINRVVWSRDASAPFMPDRVASLYTLDVSEDGKIWRTVVLGQDEAAAGASVFAAFPPPDAALRPRVEAYRALLSRLDTALSGKTKADEFRAYVGQFSLPEPVYVLSRGDVMHRGEQVRPGALSQVKSLPDDLDTFLKQTAAGPRLASVEEKPKVPARLALARWIGSPRNPLTARVLVNRLWAHHFGRGLVGTPSDFGNNGERPTHPELLDWLADDFMRHGWTMKRIHRLMVTSYAYRQASAINPAMAAKDGDNKYLWRMPLRRMEAEAARDAVLLTSGKLNRAMYGPSFRLYKYEVVNIAIYTPRDEQGPETWRRAVYHQPARGIRDSLLGTLDCPDSSERAAKRSSTITALQALSLFNGSFANEQAEFFAQRATQEAGADTKAQIARAFLLAFGRPPRPDEARESLSLVKVYGLPTLCRALLNATEFLYY